MKLRTSIYSFLKITLFSCDIGKKIKIHVLKALFLTKKQTKTKQQTKKTLNKFYNIVTQSFT